MKALIFFSTLFFLFTSSCLVSADILYVGTSGTDTGSCTNQSTPCRTISYGVGQMASGDTLIVGNGTYTSSDNIIRDPPSGTAGAYTTIQAETDFGVFLDGSSWGNNSWVYGIRIDNRSYIKVQGFRVNAAQNDTGGPMSMSGSDHIKIIKCGFAGGPVNDNGETAGTGPNTDYILFEDCYSYGGGRSGFTAYWSDHTIFRRCVSRNDYYNFDLQTAGFVNYDSRRTIFQNNIAIDVNGDVAPSPSLAVYAPFFFEDKSDHEANTSIEMYGNIALNYISYYGSIYDQVPADYRIFYDNILWGNSGGLQAVACETGECTVAPTYDIKRLTSGSNNTSYDSWNNAFDHNATYSGGDGLNGAGTGISIYHNDTNTVVDSIFVNNQSYGIADYVSGDYNALYGNGTNYGGTHIPTAGTHDITSHNIIYNSSTNPTGSLKYLPRGAEAGSTLASAGTSGGPVGAQVMWKVGVDGTLYGEPGYNTVRSPENGYGNTEDRLWPFPNEDQIKSDMQSYSGGGLSGDRGFASSTATQLDGTSPVTLTSYIWEYLGNEIPSELYEDPSCSNTPSLCGDQSTCESAGWNWCTDVCQSSSCNPITNGICGSNDGSALASLSSGDTNNCSVGDVDSFSGSGPWSWICLGTNGGSNDSCSASFSEETADFHVGPTQTYTQLSDIEGLVSPGDLVLVDGDSSYNDVGFDLSGTEANPITIRGVRINGNRPAIVGGVNTVRFSGDHYVMEGFDISGSSSRCVYHNADDITLRDSAVHNCASQGIASSDEGSGDLTLQYVEVYDSGSGTQSHPLYVETDEYNHPGSRIRIEHSYIHDNNGGNAIKSRAERNEFYYNWIDNSLYRALELIGAETGYPNQPPELAREDSDIVGNVIRQTGANPMIRIGGDKVDAGSGGRYRFVNNTMVTYSSDPVFQLFLDVESVEMHNNVIYRTNGNADLVNLDNVVWVGGRVIGGSNNWLQTGATNVPVEWTGTVVGTSAGFNNVGALDFTTTELSSLINAGGTPSSPSGYDFQNPLFPPLYQPPNHAIEDLNTATTRGIYGGAIDIGAFELNENNGILSPINLRIND